MSWTEVLEVMGALIPVAGFAAAIVASIVYIRYKGTIEALKETVNTYERLAGGYKEEAETLRCEIKELKEKVEGMEKEMTSQAMAFEKLTEKFIDSLKYGACIYSQSCDNFKSPSRVGK